MAYRTAAAQQAVLCLLEYGLVHPTFPMGVAMPAEWLQCLLYLLMTPRERYGGTRCWARGDDDGTARESDAQTAKQQHATLTIIRGINGGMKWRGRSTRLLGTHPPVCGEDVASST